VTRSARTRSHPGRSLDGWPGWIASEGYHPISANYKLLNDNLLDLSHETYVHVHTIGRETVLGDGDVDPAYKVAVKADAGAMQGRRLLATMIESTSGHHLSVPPQSQPACPMWCRRAKCAFAFSKRCVASVEGIAMRPPSKQNR